MTAYIIRRLLYMVVILWVVSVVAFAIIQLPPGDFLTAYIAAIEAQGSKVSEDQVASLRRQFDLDVPTHLQYLRWIGRILTRGYFGRSFQWQRPVGALLAERVPFTVLLSLLSLLFTYAVAVPVGIYSATHQYAIGDYVATVLGFIGLAVPNFLLALILMFFLYKYFGISVGGLFSSEYMGRGWSAAKALDGLRHLVTPIVIIGLAGTAGLIRVMRGNLLDELQKQYVVTARAKGVAENKLLFKYPVRLAINPIVSTIGWVLPAIVSGSTIVSIVLNLPTTGPLLFQALLNQDMFLAGSIVLILACLTVIGTAISDILLLVVDPRIRFEKGR